MDLQNDTVNKEFGVSWIDCLNSNSCDIGQPLISHEVERYCYICGLKLRDISIEELKNYNFACRLCAKIAADSELNVSLPKELNIQQCPTCQKLKKPPYVHVEWESNEMMVLLLQRLKPFLSEYTVESSNFIYTECHSKRIQIKLRIKHKMNNSLSQHDILFKIMSEQCSPCQRRYTPHQYQAVVQIRLRSREKGAIASIFNKVVKQKAIENACGLMEQQYGFDVYFNSRSDAQTLVHAIEANHLVSTDLSKTLKSHNRQCNTYDYVFTFICTVANIKRRDIIIVEDDKRVFAVGLVQNIGLNLTVLSLPTMDVIKISGHSLMTKHKTHEIKSKSDTCHFMVVDIEEGGHMKLLRVKFSHATETYESLTDTLLSCRSPLCQHAVVGDVVIGYQLVDDCGNNIINETVELLGLKGISNMPDVLLLDTVKDTAFVNREDAFGRVEWKEYPKSVAMEDVQCQYDTDDGFELDVCSDQNAVVQISSQQQPHFGNLSKLIAEKPTDVSDICRFMSDLKSNIYDSKHDNSATTESLLHEFQKFGN